MRSLLLSLLLLCAALASAAALPNSRSLLQYDTAAISTGSNTSTAAAAVNISEVAAAVRAAQSTSAVDLITLKTEFTSEGSSISVGEAYDANTLAVQFRFAACTGTQLHHHSGVELMQAVVGDPTVGIISPSNSLATYNFTAGQAVVIPAGWVHYYLNRGCETAILVATWPSNTKTTFELAALAAIPASLFGDIFSTTDTTPPPQPGFPLIKDPDCLARCAANASSSSAAGGR